MDKKLYYEDYSSIEKEIKERNISYADYAKEKGINISTLMNGIRRAKIKTDFLDGTISILSFSSNGSDDLPGKELVPVLNNAGKEDVINIDKTLSTLQKPKTRIFYNATSNTFSFEVEDVSEFLKTFRGKK